MNPSSLDITPQPHVVARLRTRLLEARQMGFHIRQEFLDGQPAAWCEIGGRKTVFLDSSQTAIEQLASLEEMILSYRPPSRGISEPRP